MEEITKFDELSAEELRQVAGGGEEFRERRRFVRRAELKCRFREERFHRDPDFFDDPE
jgi:hypothetical protein